MLAACLDDSFIPFFVAGDSPKLAKAFIAMPNVPAPGKLRPTTPYSFDPTDVPNSSSSIMILFFPNGISVQDEKVRVTQFSPLSKQ